MSMGVILTDHRGCPVYMNARAEALLVRGSAKAGHFGISVPNASETDHLQALVRAGAHGRSGEMTSCHDEGELRWRVVPLDPEPVQGVAIASSVRVAVFVSEMAVTVPPWQCIAARCSLTQAETRLAAALTNGQSLKDIVRRTGISIETARSQLKACFAKTGTHRQSELVCLLLKGVSVQDPPNRKSR
jgi:DNA-binding CsgD family transcriptional regulator